MQRLANLLQSLMFVALGFLLEIVSGKKYMFGSTLQMDKIYLIKWVHAFLTHLFFMKFSIPITKIKKHLKHFVGF
jgi:hypothetical protein